MMSNGDCKTLFFTTASVNTGNLVHAAPVDQIQATLIEWDWRGPPRPLLSPRGSRGECVSGKLRVRAGMCVRRAEGISF